MYKIGTYDPLGGGITRIASGNEAVSTYVTKYTSKKKMRVIFEDNDIIYAKVIYATPYIEGVNEKIILDAVLEFYNKKGVMIAAEGLLSRSRKGEYNRARQVAMTLNRLIGMKGLHDAGSLYDRHYATTYHATQEIAKLVDIYGFEDDLTEIIRNATRIFKQREHRRIMSTVQGKIQNKSKRRKQNQKAYSPYRSAFAKS